MKVKELIDLVNNNPVYCADELYLNDCFSAEVKNELPKCLTVVECDGLKNYIEGVAIYPCEDGFVGVKGAVLLLNGLYEYNEYSCDRCVASEYVEVMKPTYEPKQD